MWVVFGVGEAEAEAFCLLGCFCGYQQLVFGEVDYFECDAQFPKMALDGPEPPV